MCKVLGKYTGSDTFTGYKIVNKVNGKYYSPVTGIEYIPGQKVKEVNSPKDCNKQYIIEGWIQPCELFKQNCVFFEPLMKGKTGVIITL